MNNIPNTIAVVGGGTAGYVAAIILKTRFPNIKLDVIQSSKIGIVGVGEGSTEHWNEFLKFAGIDLYTLMKECDCTCKLGIMFDGWADKPYLHSIQTEYNHFIGQYPYMYARQIANGLPSTDMTLGQFWNNEVDTYFVNNTFEAPSVQFHFNTNKLNNFLKSKAESIGITVIEDEISDVELNETGSIGAIYGEHKKYNYDFYIDSTGFRRILISKLGAKWQSYSKYLKANAAIAFPTPDTDNYNTYTLAKAMDYGWLFRLPVWGRHGNGYIFNSDYITDEQAKAEVEQYFGHEIEIGKTFRFDPGALDNVWIKNCCAIGLSASFIEPMEASSIGTSIQQAFLLMHKLPNYNETVVKKYNKSVTDILENIRDFVVLHYMTKKTNTNFWTDVSNMPLPDSLSANLEMWEHKMPVRDDFSGLSDFILFKEPNFALVMHGLGLFNKDSIMKEYSALEQPLRNHADELHKKIKEYDANIVKITHKEYIKSVRDYDNK